MPPHPPALAGCALALLLTLGAGDAAGQSIKVVSGGTRVSENFVRHATGVDLLVHEVASRESFVREGAGGRVP